MNRPESVDLDVIAARLAEVAPALTDGQTLTVLVALRKTKSDESRSRARPKATVRCAA